VANAVRSAVGLRMADLPISPPKLLAALDAAAG
jgi:CO/xanthine dehydrogenase Mo-binding subunit